jgi:hypothetical protein
MSDTVENRHHFKRLFMQQLFETGFYTRQVLTFLGIIFLLVFLVFPAIERHLYKHKKKKAAKAKSKWGREQSII